MSINWSKRLSTIALITMELFCRMVLSVMYANVEIKELLVLARSDYDVSKFKTNKKITTYLHA